MNAPNILIYMIDELSASALGCYDHPYCKTPNIDRIGASGMLFADNISNCPLCMPARQSFFTARYPSEHGIIFNRTSAEAERRLGPTPFQSMLADAGFGRVVNVGKHHTGFSPRQSGFSEHIPVSDLLGASPGRAPKGADESRLVISPGQAPNVILGGVYPGDGVETSGYQVAGHAERLLPELAGETSPWLLRLSFVEPHTPVLPPEPYASMYADQAAEWSPDLDEFGRRTPLLERWVRRRGWDQFTGDQLRTLRAYYYGLVSFLDQQVGRVEAALSDAGLTDNLITIFTADHGSSIGDHLCHVKGPFDTDDIARTPLLIRAPGLALEGSRYRHLTQIIDLVPTLAELLGASVEGSGSSLAAVLRNPDLVAHDAVFSEGSFPAIHPGIRESIRTETHLYTRYPAIGEEELFDRAADPRQGTNVASEQPDVANRLSTRLTDWRKSHPVADELFQYAGGG